MGGRTTIKLRSMMMGAALLPLATAAFGQSAAEQERSEAAEPADAEGSRADAELSSAEEQEQAAAIVVTGSRLPASLRTMPQSVDVLSTAQIEEQLAVSPNLEQVLANLVPGLSRASNATVSTYLSLRGRKPVFFVDGVPITSTLNDTGRELRLIDPTAIQRIEVVRGSSALYGNSAGAGFINYLTKRGDEGTLNLRTEIGLGLSLTELSDSERPSIRQSASGSIGDFDYRVSGYYEKINSFFDADGNRIPPPVGAALQDSDIYSLFGKLGYNIGDKRIEAFVSYYKQESVRKYGVVNGNILLGIPATAVRVTPPAEEVPQLNRNLIASLSYTDPSFLGTRSSFRTQVYYLESYSIFQYVANRFPRVVPLGQSPNGQSANDTVKYGARLDINTPLDSILPLDGQVLWGVDYLHDNTQIPNVDGRAFGIPQVMNAYAGFIQVQVKPFSALSLSAGIRHEKTDIDVGDFFSLFTLARITGGRLSYSTTPINFGAVLSVAPFLDLFGGFSQGFDIQQTSQNFRSWPRDIDLTKVQPPANVINSYEGGVRVHHAGLEASATVFRTTSSDGVSYVFNAAAPNEPQPVVSPDRVHGVELAADYAGIKGWQLGASYAWIEGDADNNNDGSYETPLPNRRIPPEKATAYVQYEIGEGSFLRLQALRSGGRNRFPNTVPGRFHEGKINPYTQIDFAGHFELGRAGSLTVGVENLLNKDYFTNYSEGFNTNDNYLKAQGRTLSLKYAISY